jgi:subtilisin family serine protease
MRRLIVQLLPVIPLITLVLSCVTEPEPEPEPAAAVSGQYLVRIDRPAASVGTLAAINAIMDAEPLERCSGPGQRPVYLYPARPGQNLSDLNERLKDHDGFAQKNFVYQLEWPIRDGQWDLDNDGTYGTADVDVNAPEAWNAIGAITPATPRVAVVAIDTGARLDHPDLAGSLWENPLEAAGVRGVDDDANGYIDDVNGINATVLNYITAPTPMSPVLAGVPNDLIVEKGGHGTAIAGIIAAKHDEQYVAGFAPGAVVVLCKAIPSNFVSGQACTTCEAIKCLDYVSNLQDKNKNDVHIVAINMSWGDDGGGAQDEVLLQAIRRQRDREVIVVASAGNGSKNVDCTPHYPSSLPSANIIAVAETDADDDLSSLSSYGRRSVDVFAPSWDVPLLTADASQEVDTLGGTSFAAAHVSGLVALLRLADLKNAGTDWSWVALRNLVLAGGTPMTSTVKGTVTNRRIRAWDPQPDEEEEGATRTGSLSCARQLVETRLEPITGCGSLPNDAFLLPVNKPLPIVFARFDCAKPMGPLTANVSDVCDTSHSSDIPLEDAGTNADEVANDGYFSASWSPWLTPPWSTTWNGWKRLDVKIVRGAMGTGQTIDQFVVCKTEAACQSLSCP